MIFTALSLLVVLAIVGLVTLKQLKTTGLVATGARPASAAVADGLAPAAVPPAALVRTVPADVARALEQGVVTRQVEAGQ